MNHSLTAMLLAFGCFCLANGVLNKSANACEYVAWHEYISAELVGNIAGDSRPGVPRNVAIWAEAGRYELVFLDDGVDQHQIKTLIKP